MRVYYEGDPRDVSLRSVAAPSITLDHWIKSIDLSSTVRLMKLDIQGAEPLALAGGVTGLRRPPCRPDYLLLEYTRRVDTRRLCALLEAFDYAPHVIARRGRNVVLQTARVEDITTKHDYVFCSAEHRKAFNGGASRGPR